MIIEYEGESHEFDFDDITVKQAIKIEKHSGRSLESWGQSLENGGDMLALQALGWLILAGGAGAIEDTDFKIVPLGRAFRKAQEAEAAAAAQAPVPTAAVPDSTAQPDPAANGTAALSGLSSPAG